MAPVMTAFEQWLETVCALAEKRGVEPLDLDVAFYMSLYRDGLDPEQAIAEAACL